MNKLNEWFATLALRVCFFGKDLADDMAKNWKLFSIRCFFFLENSLEPRLCSLPYLMDSQICGTS